MSIMLITHDLGVIAETADEVAVMYLGRVVEFGAAEDIFTAPKHPYTRGLLRSIPDVDAPRTSRLESIDGSVPGPFRRIDGCPFHPRCPDAIAGVCDVGDRPALMPMGGGGEVACALYSEEAVNAPTG